MRLLHSAPPDIYTSEPKGSAETSSSQDENLKTEVDLFVYHILTVWHGGFSWSRSCQHLLFSHTKPDNHCAASEEAFQVGDGVKHGDTFIQFKSIKN